MEVRPQYPLEDNNVLVLHVFKDLLLHGVLADAEHLLRILLSDDLQSDHFSAVPIPRFDDHPEGADAKH